MGFVEPNPMVGAVLVKLGRIIGLGHHRRFGHLHAEREALESARRQGHDPRGSTLYVTLEPCRHHGKQPPCTDAIIAAGISRVVYAQADPNPTSRGGAGILRAAGIPTDLSTASPLAATVALPFIRHITTDLPFVFAKWAQTIDGRLATRTGDSKWISGPTSRRRVHALRGRADAVLTGIGTVLADNPRLTPRDVHPRRTPRRVVLDARLRTPPNAVLFADANIAPVLIFADESAARGPRADALRSAGATIEALPTADGQIELRRALKALRETHAVFSVMVEAGPTLLGSLFSHDLIDAAVVHVAPRLLGDPAARAPVIGPADRIADARALTLAHARRIADDAELIYVRRPVA